MPQTTRPLPASTNPGDAAQTSPESDALPPRPNMPDPAPNPPEPQAPGPDAPNPDEPMPDAPPSAPPAPDAPLPDTGSPDPDLPLPEEAVDPDAPRPYPTASGASPESLDLARVIFDAMGDKQAEDIAILDLRPVTIMTDFFVIGTSGSPRQLKALVDAVEEQARVNLDRRPIGIDGELESGWVLLDYGDVMAHLMAADRRAYYRLEDIWQDAPLVARMA